LAVKAFLQPGACPSDSDLDKISNAVNSYVRQSFEFNQPDVRSKCQPVEPPILFIAVWSASVQPGSSEDQARQSAFDAFGTSDTVLQDLGANGTFGIYVNASLIVTLAQRAFAALPQTWDVNGAPNSYGPIHLTDLAVPFPTPDDVSKGVNNFIKTYVNGYDTQVWPPVHFTTTITDTLGLNSDTDPACPERQCQSATPQVST